MLVISKSLYVDAAQISMSFDNKELFMQNHLTNKFTPAASTEHLNTPTLQDHQDKCC